MQETLETCKNTDEAVKFVTQAKRAGNDLLMIADAEGIIKTVEISHNHYAIRNPVNDQIINTNHYHTHKMQKHEVPRNAVFYGNVPKEFLGTRVHESIEQRLRRVQELFEDQEKVDENKITAILRDHGRDDKLSNLTICQHGEYLSTLRSVIFYPNR